MKQDRIAGRFAPGVSGNPRGRPPKPATRADSAAIVHQPRTVTRTDGYFNKFSGHGTNRDRRVFTGFQQDIVTDLEALDLWETEFLAARIIEALPEEAYRRGWSLKLKDEELAEAVETWASDLGVEHCMVEAAEKERALGGSAIFPVIDGAQGDLSEPIDWGAIGDIKALHVLEPRELNPVDFDNSLDSRHFRMPSRYMFTPLTSGWGSTYGMQVIHASRLVIFPGLRVTHQVRIGQRLGWGTSVLSRPKRVLADFGLAWASAATLLHEHGVGVLEMDEYANLMGTDEGEEIVARRLAGMMMAKSTLKALVVDSKDKYTRLASSLGGLAEVLNEFKVLMSAASDGMPVSVLMGQSQSGLRTGDDDTRTWYANVEKRRAKRYKPRHEHLMRFLLAAGSGPTSGTEPDVWSVEYPSLWSPSAKEIADTRKVHMDTAAEAVGVGIVSADDVAESFFGAETYPENGDIHVNWERRKAQAAMQQVGPGDLTPEDQQAMDAGSDTAPNEDDELDSMASEVGASGDADQEDDHPDDSEPLDGEIPDDEMQWLADEDEASDADAEWDLEDDADGRADDMGGHGYNPYRANDGKFAAGVHKAKRAHAAAAERMAAAGEKSAVATARHQASKAVAKQSLSEAKAARATAKRSPTAENIQAWHAATKQAIADRATAQKHAAAADRAAAMHEKAQIGHALAQQRVHEAERKAAAPRGSGARSVELATAPEFSITGGGERVRGEPVHETVLDMLARTRPHYEHDASADRQRAADRVAQRQATEEQRARERVNPLIASKAAMTIGLPSIARHDLAPAIGANGKGYNPYRNKGKFAAGPHKERPKAAPRAAPRAASGKSTVAKPKREKFDATGHKQLIATHKETEAHHRGESIRLAGEMKALREKARTTAPRSAERQALRAQHAELAGSRNLHKEFAADARQQRVQASKDMADAKRAHAARQSQLNRPIPSASKVSSLAANDPGRAAFAKDAVAVTPDPKGYMHSRQFSPEAQQAIRDHHNKVLAAYGLHDHDSGRPGAKIVEIRTESGMGAGVGIAEGSAGLHWNKTGKIALDSTYAGLLNDHAKLDASELKQMGKLHMKGNAQAQESLDAYRVSTHEAIHGHGPEMSAGKSNLMMEEMTTESVARKVTGDVHGLHVHDVAGAYDDYITSTVRHMSELSGRPMRDASEALAVASIWHKRRSESDLHPDVAMHDLAKQAMTALGVHDSSAHNELYNRMQKIAQEQP